VRDLLLRAQIGEQVLEGALGGEAQEVTRVLPTLVPCEALGVREVAAGGLLIVLRHRARAG
jgi:hypothetical protein